MKSFHGHPAQKFNSIRNVEFAHVSLFSLYFVVLDLSTLCWNVTVHQGYKKGGYFMVDVDVQHASSVASCPGWLACRWI